MVANIIYYMIKYKCIAAVNEGNAIKNDNDPDTKYALIASSGRLYSADFLLNTHSLKYRIKNDGLTAKAVELYRDLFKIEQSELYLVSSKPNLYSAIWDKSFIYSPYLMRNSHLFREFSYFSRGKNSIIEDLRIDYSNNI